MNMRCLWCAVATSALAVAVSGFAGCSEGAKPAPAPPPAPVASVGDAPAAPAPSGVPKPGYWVESIRATVELPVRIDDDWEATFQNRPWLLFRASDPRRRMTREACVPAEPADKGVKTLVTSRSTARSPAQRSCSTFATAAATGAGS